MAASMYVKFDGVEGESMQEGYEGWIEISNFQMSSSAPPSTDLGGGSGVGKPTIHGVSYTTVAGRQTPQINKNYYEGTHFPTVQVVFLKQTGNSVPEKYYELTMSHVFVMSISNSKSEGALGSESISLKAEQYKQEYFVQSAGGDLTSVGSTQYNAKTGKSE
jgi:type VI secretion system secreted protein Hcp